VAPAWPLWWSFLSSGVCSPGATGNTVLPSSSCVILLNFTSTSGAALMLRIIWWHQCSACWTLCPQPLRLWLCTLMHTHDASTKVSDMRVTKVHQEWFAYWRPNPLQRHRKGIELCARTLMVSSMCHSRGQSIAPHLYSGSRSSVDHHLGLLRLPGLSCSCLHVHEV
jgi:hypothetical protein